jgi:hypothetical protein
MTTILQRLAQAENSMQASRTTTPTAGDAERGRVIEFMAKNNFTEAPPDADPALVAMILDLNDRI